MTTKPRTEDHPIIPALNDDQSRELFAAQVVETNRDICHAEVIDAETVRCTYAVMPLTDDDLPEAAPWEEVVSLVELTNPENPNQPNGDRDCALSWDALGRAVAELVCRHGMVETADGRWLDSDPEEGTLIWRDKS